MRKIEVCCTSVEDVLEAWYGGAVRVELCSAISCGGVTPSHGLVEEAVSAATRLYAEGDEHASDARPRLKINVLIRPREGSFVYSPSEVGTMLSDIKFCLSAGVDGVVIGALTPEGDIDMDVCRRMVEAAGGMNVTFHRAFDVCRDPERALEQIIGIGCDHLLTSGQQPKALSGAELISRLVKQADGRIVVMPGSGVGPGNIAELDRVTGASEFHSTARASVPDPDLHHVPALGFDEPAAPAPAPVSSIAEHAPQSAECQPYACRHILRTSRAVVRALVGEEVSPSR